jgi:hypothetical protein
MRETMRSKAEMQGGAYRKMHLAGFCSPWRLVDKVKTASFAM